MWIITELSIFEHRIAWGNVPFMAMVQSYSFLLHCCDKLRQSRQVIARSLFEHPLWSGRHDSKWQAWGAETRSWEITSSPTSMKQSRARLWHLQVHNQWCTSLVRRHQIPKSTTNWEPGVQTHTLMGGIFHSNHCSDQDQYAWIQKYSVDKTGKHLLIKFSVTNYKPSL